jgi:hypothetical protein
MKDEDKADKELGQKKRSRRRLRGGEARVAEEFEICERGE